MKKHYIITLLAFLLISAAAVAQTYKTILPNSYWTGYMTERKMGYHYWAPGEDTLLADGLTYLKLYYTEIAVLGKAENGYAGAIRFDEPTNRIYFSPPASTDSARILYDFNLEVGDTLTKEAGYYVEGHSSTGIDVVVTSIDSIQSLDSMWRKRFRFSPGLNYEVVEGIGNVGRDFLAVPDRIPTGNDTRFGCYKKGAACIYYTLETCSSCYGKWTGVDERRLVQNAIKVYPNPIQNVVTFRNETAKASAVEIYDTNGRLILSAHLDGNGEQSLSVSDLPGGFYYYVVKGDDFIQPGKLVKY